MRLAILTSGRQDWGILRSTCLAIRDHETIELMLLVGGTHVADGFGRTITEIEADGFEATATLDWIAGFEDDAAEQAARVVTLVTGAIVDCQPDALLLVGDRFETAAAALAATLTKVPIVHVHGGEETAGSFDNALRHAITKLSHLHLVSHSTHAQRVAAMGEDPAMVFDVGAPGLDNLWRSDLPDRQALEKVLGITLAPPLILVTVHPTTLGARPMAEVRAVVGAMDAIDATFIVTLPNIDPGHAMLRDALVNACNMPRRLAVEALGPCNFWGLMRLADAMLGNSSSALIEAPAVGLPAVNVGTRQEGRVRGVNIIDVGATVDEVVVGLRVAMSPDFVARSHSATGPFGDGHSAQRIVEILSAWTPPHPPRKPPIKVP